MSRHVLVLSGGLSYEREVSLRSGRRVADALAEAGHEVVIADADAELLARLGRQRPDAVYIALHGAVGEDGALRAVLDLAGVPYVGSDADSSRLAWDKPLAKARVRDAGVDTPDWLALPHHAFRELGARDVLARVTDALGLPLMVKPAHGGSGLGATAVRGPEDLPAAMVQCFGYDDTALVERFVDGVDIAVSVVEIDGEPRALPPVEIAPAGGVYDYAARYTAGTTTWHVPARLDPDVSRRVGEIAVAVHRQLGLRDLSRIDLLVTPQGRVTFLEANVSPGMTETSLLPLAAQHGDVPFARMLGALVDRACSR